MLSTVPGMLPSTADGGISTMLENSPSPPEFSSFLLDYDFPPWDATEDYCSPEMLIFPNDDDVIMPLGSPDSPGAAGSEPEQKPNLLLFPDQDQKTADSNTTTTTTTTVTVGPASAAMDERKRRRMISNRESARRSRMRKQRHLENLRNQVNRLRVENRELSSRLRFVLYHCNRARTDNDRLRSEHAMLRHRLSNVRQILNFRQLTTTTTQFSAATSSAWPCNNIIINPTAPEQFPSLITS